MHDLPGWPLGPARRPGCTRGLHRLLAGNLERGGGRHEEHLQELPGWQVERHRGCDQPLRLPRVRRRPLQRGGGRLQHRLVQAVPEGHLERRLRRELLLLLHGVRGRQVEPGEGSGARQDVHRLPARLLQLHGGCLRADYLRQVCAGHLQLPLRGLCELHLHGLPFRHLPAHRRGVQRQALHPLQPGQLQRRRGRLVLLLLRGRLLGQQVRHDLMHALHGRHLDPLPRRRAAGPVRLLGEAASGRPDDADDRARGGRRP
mmetsp:Transcript_93195/g.287589  ORF Transcript_93195/g.287589 Transcript_93195/m.287589 type:complete len:259 (-) Transcript_93195:72-848(-)